MAEQGLTIRKVADTSEGRRVVMYDPETGDRKLVNPDTPGDDHEPWPLAGIQIEHLPKHAMLSQSYVAAARAEGWMEVTGEKRVFKPAGPASNPWQNTHTFIHLDTITVKTMDGDVTFNVVRQPDKYDTPHVVVDEERNMVKSSLKGNPVPDTDEYAGNPETSVDWFYVLEVADDA